MTASGLDPSRLAAELTELRDHIKKCWDDVSQSEADAGWSGGWGIEERLAACMFVGKQTTMVVYQALDKIAAALATEAGTAETVKLGSVHEGAGLKGNAQNTAQPLPPNNGDTRG